MQKKIAETQDNNGHSVIDPALLVGKSTSPGPTDDGDSANPFDPRNLRLSQDFNSSVGVKKLIRTIPRRKPDKQWFWRVHPNPEYSLNTAILHYKEDNEFYLVHSDLWKELGTEIISCQLFFAINRQSTSFILPVTLSDSEGKWLSWHKSLFDAAELARKKWVRTAANMSLGAYDVYEATGEIPDPIWPDLPFPKILEIAFKDSFIQTEGHPVIRKLRGEV